MLFLQTGHLFFLKTPCDIDYLHPGAPEVWLAICWLRRSRAAWLVAPRPLRWNLTGEAKLGALPKKLMEQFFYGPMGRRKLVSVCSESHLFANSWHARRLVGHDGVVLEPQAVLNACLVARRNGGRVFVTIFSAIGPGSWHSGGPKWLGVFCPKHWREATGKGWGDEEMMEFNMKNPPVLPHVELQYVGYLDPLFRWTRKLIQIESKLTGDDLNLWDAPKKAMDLGWIVVQASSPKLRTWWPHCTRVLPGRWGTTWIFVLATSKTFKVQLGMVWEKLDLLDLPSIRIARRFCGCWLTPMISGWRLGPFFFRLRTMFRKCAKCHDPTTNFSLNSLFLLFFGSKKMI